ncbi:MAG: sodium-dependent transporter [Clostridia bacterium]|nr:sodium-dependent transporter [Clostridia bacterium]
MEDYNVEIITAQESETSSKSTESAPLNFAPVKKRSSFTSKIGFVLAAAGSAVGLGNIWRFPYLAAKYGGGIFILTYIILAVTFGFVLMIAEIAIGRKTGVSAINAFKKLNRKWGFLGVLCAIIPIIILPYYSVIGGWVGKYFVTFLSGAGAQAATDGFFNAFITSPWQPLVFFAAFVTVVFVIVLFGVEKGVEKTSKFLMPALVILTIGVTIYTLTMPGSAEGVKYYFLPDFSKFSIKTLLGALGQLFYSMSLAMGIMITYGSYMKKDNRIESSVHQIEIFDTGIALLAGLMIVPVSYVFSGGSPETLGQGPGLMFVSLPKVFATFGPVGGGILGGLFFALVLFAALTSAISLMETVISIVMDKFKLSRRKSCLITYIGTLLLGIPSALGFGVLSKVSIGGMTILDMFDFLSNSVLMPVAAFLTCIFIGYVIKCRTITDEIELNGKFAMKKFFNVMVKYICPLGIAAILITAILDVAGVLAF